jgi:hypothetical protein
MMGVTAALASCVVNRVHLAVVCRVDVAYKKRTQLNTKPTEIDTELPDLGHIRFDELAGELAKSLASFQDAIMTQVERPRYNLGSGPPGRAD